MINAEVLPSFRLLDKVVSVGSGTATIAGVDLKGYIGNIKLILGASANVADGAFALTLNLKDSADNTTFATITSPTFAPATVSTSNVATVSLDPRSVRRYIQINHVLTGTTATVQASVVGVGFKNVMP